MDTPRFVLAIYNAPDIQAVEGFLFAAKLTIDTIQHIYIEGSAPHDLKDATTLRSIPFTWIHTRHHAGFINRTYRFAPNWVLYIDLSRIAELGNPAHICANLHNTSTGAGDIYPHRPVIYQKIQAISLAAFCVHAKRVRRVSPLLCYGIPRSFNAAARDITDTLTKAGVQIQHHTVLTAQEFSPPTISTARDSLFARFRRFLLWHHTRSHTPDKKAPVITPVNIRTAVPTIIEYTAPPTYSTAPAPLLPIPTSNTQPATPLTVAVVLHALAIGGVEWWMLQAILHARSATLLFTLFTLVKPPKEYTHYLHTVGIDLRTPPNNCIDETAAVAWLEEQLHGYNVVQYGLQRLWSLWPRPPRNALVCVNTGGARPESITNEQYRRTDVVMAISSISAAANRTTYSSETSMYVVPFGINTLARDESIRRTIRQRLHIPQTARVILWAGRMYAWEKNLPLLQKAIEQSAKDTWWIVLGYFINGDEERAWRDYIANKPVAWLSNVPNWQMNDYYQAADIVTSTSTVEGLGLTVIEGMAAGLPAVVTDSGGVRDSVIDGKTGYIAQTDSAYLRALHTMCTLPEQTFTTYAKAAAHHVRTQFSPQKMAAAVTAIYQNEYAKHKIQQPSPTALTQSRTIVFIFHGPDIGGMPWRALYTAQQLAMRGHRVHFIFQNRQPTSRGRTLLEYFAGSSVTAECASDHFGYERIDSGSFNWYLGLRLPSLQPDNVQIGWLPEPPINACNPLWRTHYFIAGTPTIATLKKYPAFCKKVTTFVCVSDAIARRLPKSWHDRAVTIPSAVIDRWYRTHRLARPKIRALLHIPKDRPTIIWTGRINDPYKRADLLARLVKDFPDYTFIIAAITASKTPTMVETQLEEASNTIVLRDFAPTELIPIYAAADIGLSTSDMEGLSVSSLEMLASSLPLLLTAADGAHELVDDGINGLVVPCGDYSKLAEGLCYLLSISVSQRMTMGNASSVKAATTFSFSAYIAAYCALYERM